MKEQPLKEKMGKVQGTFTLKSKSFTAPHYLQIELSGVEVENLKEVQAGDRIKLRPANTEEKEQRGDRMNKSKSAFIVTSVDIENQILNVAAIIVDQNDPKTQAILEAEEGLKLAVKVKSALFKGKHHQKHGEKHHGMKEHGIKTHGHHDKEGQPHGRSHRGESVVFASPEQIAAAEERLAKLMGGKEIAGKGFGGKGHHKGHGMKHGHHHGKGRSH
ncbi:hypothetical protein [Mangrovibacterium diazotrophicum]|uniref:Uncharacterized protein n=1 Tax=Mangrovibacterium diazotrophicum TaxID=1261403 RepID=A0A419VW47_9BACT|nr:hypothetical protein [Mangrovibacterium diazotrophicum]RKD86365.1 hypothetical protein BC643_4056 [Mangrovibacterium diazotrophicum]